MSGWFLIKDNLDNKISYYHLLLLMASLSFDMFYSHLILISLAIHTLIHLKRNTIKPVPRLAVITLTSVFFVTVLSSIYTINAAAAYQEWGRQITILLFPLIFWLNPLDLKKYRQNLLMAFALVCTATIAYLFIDALVVIRHYHLPTARLFSRYFTNHNFSWPIAIHATFFSMQVAVALVFMLSVLIKERAFYNKLFYLCCCAILSAGLIQLGSKSVVMAMIVIINLGIPYFMRQSRMRRRFMWISASLTVLIIAGVLSLGNFRERYITGLKDDLSKSVNGRVAEGRLVRWNVAIGVIAKSPVLGHGAGSETPLLLESYFNKKMYISYLARLNAHSEYLSFLIKSGIVGLLIYLATLARGFTISFRRKDILLFSFMLLVAFVSLSENLLDVDKGVIFYAFFFSFFMFSSSEMKVITKPAKIIINNYSKATKALVATS